MIGISHEDLARHVAGFAGLDLRVRVSEDGGARAAGLPDAIAGATVSSGVIRDAIIRAGRAVARSRGLLGEGRAQARLDRETYAPATWSELVADGSIAERRISRGEAASALSDTDRGGEEGNTYVLFADLFTGLLTPPRIGENLLGKLAFGRRGSAGCRRPGDLRRRKRPLSFKGTGHVRTGRFDGIQVVQGTKTIPLTTDGYENVERLAVEGSSGVPGNRGVHPPARDGIGSARVLASRSPGRSRGRRRRSAASGVLRRLPAAAPLPLGAHRSRRN